MCFLLKQGREVFIRSPWHQLRHPLIFYYGHVAALYINKLRLAGLVKDPVDAELEQIMETGVDEMSWDDLSKNEMEWPDPRRVTEYRRIVYGIVVDVIMKGNWSFPIKLNDPAWALIMGFEHERIHLETSSVLMRELPAYLVTRPAQFPKYHPSAFDGSAERMVQNEMIAMQGGDVNLGKPHDWPSFGWDNEYGTRSAKAAPFSASKFLITNGEFLEFVRSGGYGNRVFWTEAGWQWRVFRNIHFPTFWCPDGPVGLHKYKLRVIFDVIEMPLSWPVDVNVHEAKAYCAWKTLQDRPQQPYRLITEVEHNVLRDAATQDKSLGPARDPVMAGSGKEIVARKGAQYNSNLAWGSQCPVDALAPSSTGFYDVFGNAWHWTEDDFNMLDGFEVSPLYVDFSTPCFDGLHNLIMGGSFISTGDEASMFSRFHFRPHFHQHASFRMCSGANAGVQLPKLGTNGLSSAAPNLSVDMEQSVDEQMLVHYGVRQDLMPWEHGPTSALSFNARIAKLVVEWAGKHGIALKRVLDLGCTVGGCALELARTVPEVVGVDFPHYVAAAEEMKRDGQRHFRMKEEGFVYTEVLASVDSKIDRMRVNFKPVDPCTISAADSGSFNVVVMSNILERLPAPAQVYIHY
jgi:5-histidylcysteine sulfoxide synthase